MGVKPLAACDTPNDALGASKDTTLRTREGAVPLRRHSGLILLNDTPKGRGVFATAPISARAVIEVSPVLVLDPQENVKHVSQTRLWFYTYNWPLPRAAEEDDAAKPHTRVTRTTTQALPLGLGSMFNHASSASRRHNVGFIRDVERQVITYTALRDIEAGEELCICYGPDARLGFTDTDANLDDAVENDEATDRPVSDLAEALTTIGDVFA